jgi:hypothetical protein
MAKHPQWFDKVPTAVANPLATLKDAAKVVREDGRIRRKSGDPEGGRVAGQIASALEAVASGKTWREAFEIPNQ